MTQGELEFLCGPWQKDRRRQDARRGYHKRNAAAEDTGSGAAAWPERSSMARAPRNGPSAATWPERRDMARAQRAPQRRARVALQLKQRRGHRLDIARAHALTG